MKKKIFILIFIAVSFCILAAGKLALASEPAVLLLSPSSGTYEVGETFSVSVVINTGGTAINAAEASISFSADLLQVVNISKAGSLFSLWTENPSYSNSPAVVRFGGGIPASSYSGKTGKIITVNFKAIKEGNASLRYSNARVLAADGVGTNVLGDIRGGNYKLIKKAEEEDREEYKPPPVSGKAPGAPKITSSTHPNPDKWYSNNNPIFLWELPKDVNAVKLLVGKAPVADPSVLYSPPIKTKAVGELDDGKWYFHAKFKNKHGWGHVAHRKVLVDTEPPLPFEIKVDNEEKTNNKTPILYFETTDETSGVEYYEVIINEKSEKVVNRDFKGNPYHSSELKIGKNSVKVKAVDKAGNIAASAKDIIFPQEAITRLHPQVITNYSKGLGIGDYLFVEGFSEYPFHNIKVFIQKDGGKIDEKFTRTDQIGNWIYTYDKAAEKGTYKVWAKIVDSKGSQSLPSNDVNIRVKERCPLNICGAPVDCTMIIIIFLIIFLILLIIIAWLCYKLSKVKKYMLGGEKKKEEKKSKKKGWKPLRIRPIIKGIKKRKNKK